MDKKNLDMSMSKYYYISAHGNPLFKINKVPKGCTLIFLTPINRLCGTRTYNKIILDSMVRKGCHEEIFKVVTDICYQKEKGEILSYRQVFYEGQYYIDIELSNSKNENDMGIWHINPENNTKEDIFGSIRISEIMKIKKGNYVISTCRYFNLEESQNIYSQESLGMNSYRLFVAYFLEKITDIINTHIMKCRNSKPGTNYCSSGNHWRNTMHFTNRKKKLKRTFSGILSPVPNPRCRECGKLYSRKGNILSHGNKVNNDGLCDECAPKKGKINRLLSIFKKNKKIKKLN